MRFFGTLHQVPARRSANRHNPCPVRAATIGKNELIHAMRDVAIGRRRIWAEKWKLRNALTPFNPAPVT
jgi:hypothetical protein